MFCFFPKACMQGISYKIFSVCHRRPHGKEMVFFFLTGLCHSRRQCLIFHRLNLFSVIPVQVQIFYRLLSDFSGKLPVSSKKPGAHHTALNDCPMVKSVCGRHLHQSAHFSTAAGLSINCHIVRISAESCNIPLYPA